MSSDTQDPVRKILNILFPGLANDDGGSPLGKFTDVSLHDGDPLRSHMMKGSNKTSTRGL